MNAPRERAAAARQAIRARFPVEYDAGARAGFVDAPDYPHGFHAWSRDRREAFYAGFNAGRVDRLRRAKGGDHG